MESDFGQNAENGQTTMTPDHELVEGVSPSMRSLVSVMLEVAKSECRCCCWQRKARARSNGPAHSRTLAAGWAKVQAGFMHCSGGWQIEDSGGKDILAGGGTVFLEELSELNAQGQARLLQALTGRSANSSGAQRAARLICGSACDLEAEVKAGNLREDLYYRISGVCLRPPTAAAAPGRHPNS